MFSFYKDKDNEKYKKYKTIEDTLTNNIENIYVIDDINLNNDITYGKKKINKSDIIDNYLSYENNRNSKNNLDKFNKFDNINIFDEYTSKNFEMSIISNISNDSYCIREEDKMINNNTKVKNMDKYSIFAFSTAILMGSVYFAKTL